ncbi:MAG TPA: hypothetical protein ENN03_00005 [bacterium]|nr:hypothetical protein [bacterium]
MRLPSWINGTFAAGMAVLMMTGCAGTRLGEGRTPPGIEPALARYVKGESSRLLVPFSKRQSARQSLERGIHHWNVYQESLDSGITDRRPLQRSHAFFSEAVEKNPWDVKAFLYLGRACIEMARLEPESKTFADAYQALSRASELDRGGADICYEFGELKRLLKDWNGARQWYQKTLDRLWTYAFLPAEPLSEGPSFLDTTLVFRSLYRIGEIHVRLYEAGHAFRYFENAYLYARTEEERTLLDDYLRWLRWGDGNIRAREYFEQAVNLESDGRLNEAMNQYQRVLAELTMEGPARWETQWRIARLEYTLNPDSVQKAVDRLRAVVESVPKSSAGVAEEPYSLYVNDLAVMLIQQSKRSESREQRENYLAEAGVLVSPLQGSASLAMTRHLQNARFTGLLWALKAYSCWEQLDERERDEWFVLIKRVCRRPRNPFLLQYFNEKVRSLRTGGAPNIDSQTELMALEFIRSGYAYLDDRLQERFGVLQHQKEIEEYGRLYAEKERLLPAAERREVRRRISEFYHRQFGQSEEHRTILEEWRNRLRVLSEFR